MKGLNQSVQWHITEVCPNRCKHCYIDGRTNEERRCNELGWEGMLKIISNFEQFEQKYDVEIDNYVITGGDPFEHSDFEKLLSELHARKKYVAILGIPERISIENLKMLEKYHVREYQVSLDGMQETHDKIRGKGSFEKTIRAVRLMNQNSSIKPKIMYTVHKQNYRELFDVIEFLDSEELEVAFAFDFLVLEGSAKDNCDLLDKQEVDELLTLYRKKRLQLQRDKRKLSLREKVKLFETYDIEEANEKFSKYSYVSGCYCGFNSCTVLPNGDMLACRRLPIKIGNLLEDSYIELFLNNQLMRRLRRISSYKLCNDCDYAKVCRGCPALAYSVSGDVFGKMEYCSRKKSIKPLISEPALDCTEEEEWKYIKNTPIIAIQTEGIADNLEAVKHDIYKYIMLQKH